MSSIRDVLPARRKLVRYASLLYLITGFSWLFGPILNHRLQVGPNMISEYEANGMPHAVLFRLFDALSALALLLAVYLARKRIAREHGRWLIIASILIVVLSIIDIVSSPHCSYGSRVCAPQHDVILLIHFVESLLLGLTFFYAGIRVSLKNKAWAWGPLLQASFGIAGLIALRAFNHGLFALQLATLMVQAFWLWRLLFGGYFTEQSPIDIGFVRRGLAIVLGLGGILSVLAGTRYGTRSLTSSIGIGPATAWLAQHNLIVGIAFLYLARKVYQGERTAYRLSLILMALQVVKYSAVVPRMGPLFIYGLMLLLLILSRDYFVRHSSPRRFFGRFRAALFALVGSAVLITLVGVLFRLREPEAWKRSSLSAGQIVMRVTLLEITPDKGDSLRVRLFAQTLTTAGFAMYAWILIGLFSPDFYSLRHADELDRERMRDILDQYGTSSEDSFKLWPEDKKYWFSANDKVAIAYKQHRGFVVGLHAPAGPPRESEQALKTFRDYCRQHGWTAVWLLINDQTRRACEAAQYRSFKVGASAVVDVKNFAEVTVRNKWWRWNRNKAAKLELSYEVLRGPLTIQDIEQLAAVSSAWLGSDNHDERSFALGYFDITFLEHCVLHVLRDQSGRIVAFMNQLPSYNLNSQATTDLMRALPEYEGVTAYLISEVLLHLSAQERFKTFDLGFVPLAQTELSAARKTVVDVTAALLDAYFSARGLRQFKNKFEPEWQDNFVAWDGDLLELGPVAQAIGKVLEYEKPKPK